MILTKKWPKNLEYITCDYYTGSNTPQRLLDLKSFFINVTEPATFGSFFMKRKAEFNGVSRMKFTMDILGVTARSGKCNKKILGNWTADFSSPFYMDKSLNDVGELSFTKVYRVSTVVVKKNSVSSREVVSSYFFSHQTL